MTSAHSFHAHPQLQSFCAHPQQPVSALFPRSSQQQRSTPSPPVACAVSTTSPTVSVCLAYSCQPRLGKRNTVGVSQVRAFMDLVIGRHSL
ncbi:hypothetical protein L208DRAFT_1398899 [Tricholoma matsutake]|nr:hypothetical protein L208DRAFT_1398899 [Tricholoma matsutake 945]